MALEKEGSLCGGSSYGTEEAYEERWSEQNIQHVRDLYSLTDQQLEELLHVKNKLSDVDHWKNNPYELVRFTTGPQGYIVGETLFREMIDWRLENNVDNILDEHKPHPVLYRYIPSAILKGYDHDGDPIYLERGGQMDGCGLLKRFSKETLMHHVTWSRELALRGRWIKEYEREQQRPPTRVTIVYDLHGLNSRHLRSGVIPMIVDCLRLTQLRYNGTAKKMIAIRAPSVFFMMWSLVKHIFPKKAVEKMVFTGPNNYKEVLSKYMDLEVLPPCVCPEGKGGVAMDQPPYLDGGLIPDHIPAEWEEEAQCISATTSECSSDLETIVESSSPVSVRCHRITGGYVVRHTVKIIN